MLQGSLSLFLMRLFSQMYNVTSRKNIIIKLDCINHLFLSTVWPGYLYYSLVTSHFPPQAPPTLHRPHSTVITKQSSDSEWRVMACTLWLHKARPGKHTFSSHRLIIRAFCTGDKRESRRRDLATQTQPAARVCCTYYITPNTWQALSMALPCYNKNMGTL